MDCKHEIPDLMGTGEGILCRRCGKLFKSFAEIQGEPPAADPAPAPKRGRKKKEETPNA